MLESGFHDARSGSNLPALSDGLPQWVQYTGSPLCRDRMIQVCVELRVMLVLVPLSELHFRVRIAFVWFRGERAGAALEGFILMVSGYSED